MQDACKETCTTKAIVAPPSALLVTSILNGTLRWTPVAITSRGKMERFRGSARRISARMAFQRAFAHLARARLIARPLTTLNVVGCVSPMTRVWSCISRSTIERAAS